VRSCRRLKTEIVKYSNRILLIYSTTHLLKMSKSSIHIVPVKAGSEKHNQREKELSYVRSDLSHLNSSFVVKSVREAKEFVERNCKEKTRRSMQAKATPIREGVLLIGQHHTAEHLKKLAISIEERFGIKTIQGYCHKDEGHKDKITGEWKPNYHAHLVFDWTDHSTGKSIKMSRDDMAELQTLVADSLGLERGVSSSKEHLNAIQYKSQQEQKDLEMVYGFKKGLSEAKTVLQQADSIKKEIEPLKTAKNSLVLDVQRLADEKEKMRAITEQEKQRAIEERQKTESESQKIKQLQQEREKIDFETALQRENLAYLKEKSEDQQERIQANEQIIKQQETKIDRSRNFGIGGRF